MVNNTATAATPISTPMATRVGSLTWGARTLYATIATQTIASQDRGRSAGQSRDDAAAELLVMPRVLQSGALRSYSPAAPPLREA